MNTQGAQKIIEDGLDELDERLKASGAPGNCYPCHLNVDALNSFFCVPQEKLPPSPPPSPALPARGWSWRKVLFLPRLSISISLQTF